MRKLNLSDYSVRITLQTGEKTEMPFQVRESLVVVMFNPDLRLGCHDALRNNILASKIEQCKEDKLLIEETEYAVLKNAIEAYKGYGRNEVELINRVLNAETVEVTEKK